MVGIAADAGTGDSVSTPDFGSRLQHLTRYNFSITTRPHDGPAETTHNEFFRASDVEALAACPAAPRTPTVDDTIRRLRKKADDLDVEHRYEEARMMRAAAAALEDR